MVFWAEGTAVAKAKKGDGKYSVFQELKVGGEGDEAGETTSRRAGRFHGAVLFKNPRARERPVARLRLEGLRPKILLAM